MTCPHHAHKKGETMPTDAGHYFYECKKDIKTETGRLLYLLFVWYLKGPQTALFEDIDLTTIINFNRELLSSNKVMILAIKEFF